MPQLIDIPEVGQVEFPDGMDQKAIVGAIENDIIPQFRNDRFSSGPSGRPSYPAPDATMALPIRGTSQATQPSVLEAAKIQSNVVRGPDASDETVRQLLTGETTAWGDPLPEITGSRVQSAIPLLSDFPNVASVIAGVWNRGAKPIVDFPRTLPGAAATLLAPSAGLTGVAGIPGKTILGKFILDAVTHTPGLIQETEQALRSKDPGKIAGAITALSLNTAVAAGAGRGLREGVIREGSRVESQPGAPTLDDITDAIDASIKQASDPKLPLATAAAKDLFQPAEKPLQLRVEETPAQAPAPEGMVKATLAWRDLIPEELHFQVDQTVLEAAQNVQAARQRAAERTAGGKLAEGEPARSIAETPGPLRTAEQKLSQREPPPEPTRIVEEVTLDTPLKTVEEIVRAQLEQRDWLSAVETLAQTSSETSVKLVEKLTGVSKDRVPLSAAESTIFNAIWEETVKKLGGEPKPLSPRPTIEPGTGANPFPQVARAAAATAYDIRQWLKANVKARVGPNDLPAVNFRLGQMLPDFQPIEVSGKIANAPHGLGNLPGLGWMFDARARSNEPVSQAIVQRQFETHIGKNIATLMGQQIKGAIDSAFDIQPGTSRITNITTKEGKPQSTHISDFFENFERDPDAYVLTPKQREAATFALDIEKQLRDLADRNGVGRHTDNEIPGAEDRIDSPSEQTPYFTRIRIDKPEGGRSPALGGSRVGARQYFDKPRYYDTEEAGATAETPVRYEPSIEKRLVTRAQKLYQKIADKRMAENPALQGETGRDPLFGESRINLPAFQSRVYPTEIANTVNQFYNAQSSRLRAKLVSLNNASKAIGFSLDLAAPFLQGLPMFLNPSTTHLWAKSTALSLRALLDEKTLTRYLKDPDNLTAARELTQLGVSLGRLGDFMAGVQDGQFLRKLPGFKQAAQSFETFLETSILELWKAQRESTPREQWPKVAETLQNFLSHGRMAEAGMSQGQALLEQTLFLAPSYLRGSLNLMASITENGKSGSIARRGLTGMALGGSLLYVYLARQAGLDWDQITERMNPMSRQPFISVPVKFADGRVREIGFGGAIKSIIKLTAGLADAVINNNARLEPGADQNVALRWLRGKAAPLPGFVTDAILGTDFLGNDVSWTRALLARTTPLFVQTLMRRPGEPDAVAGDVIPGALGLNIYPQSIRSQFSSDRDAKARELYKTPYSQLDLKQQISVTHSTQSQPLYQIKQPTSKRMIKLAAEADEARVKRIELGLSSELKFDLNRLQVRLLGYDGSLHLGHNSVLPLTESQLKLYESSIIDAYQDSLAKLTANEKFQALEPDRRQELANRVMGAAKEAARKRLVAKIQSKSLP